MAEVVARRRRPLLLCGVHPAVERACVAGLAALPAVRSAEIQVVTTLLKEVLTLR